MYTLPYHDELWRYHWTIYSWNNHRPFPSISLDRGEVASLAFDILGLMAGTHTIQASPNTGTAIQTVNVYPVFKLKNKLR